MKLHQTLSDKHDWYRSWHDHSGHPPLHWGVLIFTSIFVTSLLIGQIDETYSEYPEIQRVVADGGMAGRNDFFNSINALPDCSSVPAGVVCKWKTVPFASQAEINSYTNSLRAGYDLDDNDMITHDPTVGMARVAIPAFHPVVRFYTLTESPATSISTTDQCLKFQNLPGNIGYGDPLVIGDYPNGTFEIILPQNNSSCPRVSGPGGQIYVIRGINNTTPQAWASGSPIRPAIKKIGVANTLDVPLNTEGINSPSAPDQGCGPACTTWYLTLDSVYDKSYLDQNKLPTGKTFKIGGAGKSNITMQVGNNCRDAHYVPVPGCDRSKDISGKVNLRHGAPQSQGGGPDWKLTNGIQNCSLSDCEVPTIGSDNGYRPQVGALIMRPNTVMRWHILIEAKYGDYDRVTLWLSDQNNNAVLIHDRLMISFGQDSAMPHYDAGTYPIPNQIKYWSLGMDISSYGDFTNTTYQDLVSWFSNLTLVRGLTRQQIEANYLPIKPVVPTSSNIAPYVSITNPVKNGVNYYPVGTNLLVTATASDFDGTVSKVEFLNNNNLIQGCTRVTTPYFCSLPLVTSGSFVLTARATDNKGLTSTSIPVTVATDGTTPPTPTPDTTAPSTPSNLSATAVSPTQINLSWSASTDNVGVTGYRLERCSGTTCTNFTQIATPSSTSHSNTGLTASTAYRYRVRAVDAAGNLSSYSSIISTTTQSVTVTPPLDTTAPSTPSNLQATAVSPTQINLSWTTSTDNVAVTGYRLERCSGTSCSNFTQVATLTGTSYSNLNLTSSTIYRYRVRAVDAAGNLSSYSSIATATTQALPDTTPPTVSLSAPAAGATVSGTTNISATASDNVGVVGVQFKLDGVNLGAEDTTSPYSYSWNTTQTTNGSKVLTAVARDQAGNTTTSAPRTVTVSNITPPVSDTTAPSTPSNLQATAVSPTQVNLSWTASTDNVAVAGYSVYRNSSQIATAITTTTYQDTGRSPSTTYSYTVRAYDAAGNISPHSSSVSATTQAPPPPPVVIEDTPPPPPPPPTTSRPPSSGGSSPRPTATTQTTSEPVVTTQTPSPTFPTAFTPPPIPTEPSTSIPDRIQNFFRPAPEPSLPTDTTPDPGTPPLIQRFAIENTDSPKTVRVNFEVSKPEGAKLWRAYLFRAEYQPETCDETNKSGCDWKAVENATAPEGSEQWSTSLEHKPAPGTHWYSFQVIDRAGNRGFEEEPVKIIKPESPFKELVFRILRLFGWRG